MDVSGTEESLVATSMEEMYGERSSSLRAEVEAWALEHASRTFPRVAPISRSLAIVGHADVP
jgi:hypothetical protein